jgi:hypothetical protein
MGGFLGFLFVVALAVVGVGAASVNKANERKETTAACSQLVSRDESGWNNTETWRCGDGSLITLQSPSAFDRAAVRVWTALKEDSQRRRITSEVTPQAGRALSLSDKLRMSHREATLSLDGCAVLEMRSDYALFSAHCDEVRAYVKQWWGGR